MLSRKVLVKLVVFEIDSSETMRIYQSMGKECFIFIKKFLCLISDRSALIGHAFSIFDYFQNELKIISIITKQ